MPPLSASELDKLIKICGRFGSDQGGERAAAAIAANRIITKAGITWADLLRPQSQYPRPTPAMSWRAMIRECRKHAWALTRQDHDLFNEVEGQAGPTEDQRKRLEGLYLKVRATAGRSAAR